MAASMRIDPLRCALFAVLSLLPACEYRGVTDLRAAVREMVRAGGLLPGARARLAVRFGVSRQRVSQIITKEKAAHEMRYADGEIPEWLRRGTP